MQLAKPSTAIRGHIAQAFKRTSDTTIEITIDPMMPVLLEKKKNIAPVPSLVQDQGWAAFGWS